MKGFTKLLKTKIQEEWDKNIRVDVKTIDI